MTSTDPIASEMLNASQVTMEEIKMILQGERRNPYHKTSPYWDGIERRKHHEQR